MSGHSHWSSIKHKKGAADAKRSKLFSKMAKEISLAAREGAGNVEFNPRLRIAIEKARSFNMSADNIDRAVKRGLGQTAGERLEAVTFEGFGPGNVPVIVEGITDNKNRALGEVKQAFNQNGGKMAGEGSAKWLFERKGCLTLVLLEQREGQDKEKMELAAIEAGGEDFNWREDSLEVYTKPEDLEKTRRSLEERRLKIESATIDWKPKDYMKVDDKIKEECQRLFEALDNLDSVQEIYSALK